MYSQSKSISNPSRSAQVLYTLFCKQPPSAGNKNDTVGPNWTPADFVKGTRKDSLSVLWWRSGVMMVSQHESFMECKKQDLIPHWGRKLFSITNRIIARNSRTFPLSCSDEPLEVRHGAERRIDLRVVRHIVAEIYHRRAVDRTEPDRLYPEVLKMVQPVLDTWAYTKPESIPIVMNNKQVWIKGVRQKRGGPCIVRSMLNKYERAGGGSLYGEVQVEQVWTCPREGSPYDEAQLIMGNGHMGLLWTDRHTWLKALLSHNFLSGR